jgi:hypothetical protein
MTELERALVALGRELDFPPDPELVGAVRTRLERPSARLAPRRRTLVFAVAVLLVAFGIAMAVPQARSAILRFFHVGGVTVERVETLPPAEERPLVAGLGPALARREAELRAHLPIVLPDFDGPVPTRYYAQPGVIATLIQYRGKPVLLAELRNDQLGVSKKLARPDTKVEPLEVSGRFGIWLEGGRHVLTWQFGVGQPREIQTRLAGNVLIWVVGDRTFRLEGALAKGQMLKLARDITR